MWALLQNGLRVPTFDRHPGGDECLQRVGLNSANWTNWFETVVNQQVEGEETFRSSHGLEPTLIYATRWARQVVVESISLTATISKTWIGCNESVYRDTVVTPR